MGYRPSKNKITGDYTNAHKGYDFSGVGDSGVYAYEDGVVEQSVNLYSTSWTATPPLTTKDYGNYIKVRHSISGITLYAHLKKDTLPVVGKVVLKGQRIATVGNTGNSTGTHLHFELRDLNNIKIKPIFEGESMNMYKGYDLDNNESMKVAVDKLVEIMNGEYIKKADYDLALKSAYDNGFKDGKLESPGLPEIDPTKWSENGLTIESTEGGIKRIVNYKRI